MAGMRVWLMVGLGEWSMAGLEVHVFGWTGGVGDLLMA